MQTLPKTGILGGGQLGRMLCQAALPWNLEIGILDPAPDCPAAGVCTRFVQGDFKNYDDVLAFGQYYDLLTIEIEHVNTEALHVLEKMGKAIHPAPRVIDIVKDKGLQKQFYAAYGIPTAPFQLFRDEKALVEAVDSQQLSFPFVQKTRTAGYDGKGVSIIRNSRDLTEKLLPGPCLTEELVSVKTEIAVIAARNPNGEVRVFPAVEMDFHPDANLVERLVCPARIGALDAARAEVLAETVIRALDVCGLLAVEMFLTTDGDLLVNEVAPRPHNSGHHTIEAAATSQFQQHLRAIYNWPLGPTTAVSPAVMLNVLGEEGHKGPVTYEGLADCLAVDGVHVHLYGKNRTAPFRKMGHLTVLGPTLEAALARSEKAAGILKALSR